MWLAASRAGRCPAARRAGQIGSAFGIAILGTVLFSTLGAQLSHKLAGIAGIPAGQRIAIVTAVKQSAGAAISHLAADPRTAPVAELAKQAFSQATRLTAFCAAIFLGLGLLASLSLGRGNTSRQSPPNAEPDPEAAGPEA